jgi:hypothetical protein
MNGSTVAKVELLAKKTNHPQNPIGILEISVLALELLDPLMLQATAMWLR